MAEKNIDKNEIVSTVDGSFIMYRNRPLVREENIICYGSMEEKYMLQMIIMSTKDFKGQSVPDKVVVQLMHTDATLPSHKRIVKQAIEDGLANAIDLGIIWLERYLAS